VKRKKFICYSTEDEFQADYEAGIHGIPSGWTVIEEDVPSSNSLDDEDELIEAFSDDIDEITTTIDSSMMPDPSTNL